MQKQGVYHMWFVCTGSLLGAGPLARFASAPAEVVWGTSPRAALRIHALLLPSTFTGRILIVHVSLLCEDMGRELTGVTPKTEPGQPLPGGGRGCPPQHSKMRIAGLVRNSCAPSCPLTWTVQ